MPQRDGRRRNANLRARQSKFSCSAVRKGSGTLVALGTVKFVVAHAEVSNAQVEQGTQPLLRILQRVRPVSVGHDASSQTRVVHHPQPYQQNRVEQEWLAAFEVNRVDCVNLLDLVQEFAKLAEGKGPLALWPAVQKAVLALPRALVGEQDVDPSQHDVLPLGAGEREMSSRPDGRRTAPSAMNWQEIDIYVALGDGLFRYNAIASRLEPILAQDMRAATGTQAFVAAAPLNLVYVADRSKTGQSGSEAELFTAADVGFISENVYLFCTSEGLATVVRGSVDRAALAKVMKLRPDQKILLAQSVGYPKK